MGRALAALVVAAVAAGPALADTVKLKNGDVLTGTVTSIAGGELTLATAAAGDVKIKTALIETISTEQPLTIELEDGTVLVGNAVAAKEGGFQVDSAVSGKRDVPLSSVKSVNKPPRHWTGNLLGAATWSRGNSESTAINVDAHAENRGEQDRITLDAWYRLTRTTDPATGNSSASERRTGAKGQYDWFFEGTKLYAYGNALGERDAVAHIDLRFIAGAGVGYQFIDTDHLKLAGEAGLAWFHEQYTDNTPTNRDPAGRLAGHFLYTFNDYVEAFDDVDYYQILGDVEYLAHNKGGLREKLTKNFFAQQWVETTYNTRPAQNKERLDIIYYVGIGWIF
jgi:putative salt-induced outer membrane protein YdiY